MKKGIIRYLVHIFSTILVLFIIGVIILLSENGSVHYGDSPLRMNWENEGPYVFFEQDSTLSIHYIQGNREEGFSVNSNITDSDSLSTATCFFNLDSSHFQFKIDKNQIKIPPSSYVDNGDIFAVSDIESGYKTFRDLLMNNKIIDNNLNWTFGNGHLVLVGDFVDRGFSTTQVLWFIYKLEQEALKQGGKVHFIIGNHEIKNMQANFESASPKYAYVAYILGKQQHELYNQNSFLGKWMSSKNSIELINGHLFMHGGIHPEVADMTPSINEMNEVIRSRYHIGYYPRKEKTNQQILTSTTKGPAWYRGYFKDDQLTQEDVEKGLNKFNAKAVIVGHTIQSKVKRKFNGKVIGIDVQHPNDYHKNWPKRKSEALLIQGDTYYRVHDDGRKEVI